MTMIARAVVLFDREGVTVALHAGDIISPITEKEFSRLRCRLICVFGNNDGEKLFLKEKFREIGELHERKWEGEIGGRRVLLIHAPDMLEALRESGAYDLIVYGHTHRAEVRCGRTLVVNPGECGGWLTGRATVAIVDTDAMSAEIREL